MNKLSNFDLQIISKYLYDFKDISELLKINETLKDNYHTTFELIYIPCDYVLPKHQIIKLINKFLNTFPNLEEVILNFTSCDVDEYIYDEYFNNILLNYLNFDNIINELNLKINVKIKFNCSLKIELKLSTKYTELKLYLYLFSKILSSKLNIIIDKYFDDTDNELYKLCEKYKYINFISDICSLDDIDKNIKYDNLYYTYRGSPFFKNNNVNNIYINNILSSIKKIINVGICIYYFPCYYNIIKLKNILKLNQNNLQNLRIKIIKNEGEVITNTYDILMKILNLTNCDIIYKYLNYTKRIKQILINDKIIFKSYDIYTLISDNVKIYKYCDNYITLYIYSEYSKYLYNVMSNIKSYGNIKKLIDIY